MGRMDPSMRLKVKRDTFYVPEPNRGVYLRNNSVSFRLEGSGLDLWVEKLLPMFNGEYSLGKITEGLQDPHRNRVFEIAEVLFQNGFVRDVSEDHPHQLTEQVLKKFASQIEFADNLAGSGAYRFQCFRESNVLAVGSGPFLNSLVSSLLESGLARVNVAITADGTTNRNRLRELVNHARKTDPEVELLELEVNEQDWSEVIRPFDSVLCVSQDLAELRQLHSVCIEEQKTFIPAILLEQVGIAGPLVETDSEVTWETAWRRLHSTVFEKETQVPGASATTAALLANVIAFEFFKDEAGLTQADQKNRIFLLDVETLDGSWHSVLAHPNGEPELEWLEDLESRLEPDIRGTEPEKLLTFFSLVTSKETGILHMWEEGDLKQLPLAQCRVQAVDPQTEGPAGLLAEQVCCSFTHDEARREAALTGIEMYAASLAGLEQYDEFIGVGAGVSYGEAVSRGLQKCLDEELKSQRHEDFISLVGLDSVGDETCRFYLNALTTIQGTPRLGLGRDLSGFPVFWVGTQDGWYGAVDLNETRALRKALQHALFKNQNQLDAPNACVLAESAIQFNERNQQKLNIPETAQENLQEAFKVLKSNGKQVFVCELSVEPFLKQELEGVFGVLLREEGVY
ncbi:putative thiazole-containing bacteriocin maturation protein [Mesobacillus subterraneus]|uniref:Putative thiazole-containing bacteriocin maturation protein n=1 Tax=Mesobacillus subterraneus TaxID=285983 RepID=A0A427TX14_9BACI|nr:putative thiazole-containing bacteriocin maturation protein [Mesobacillus subterraneus]RSD28695.1 putative thiazole-containing bacteriocin maturation protein [Mesobacillus subterraneus]